MRELFATNSRNTRRQRGEFEQHNILSETAFRLLAHMINCCVKKQANSDEPNPKSSCYYETASLPANLSLILAAVGMRA